MFKKKKNNNNRIDNPHLCCVRINLISSFLIIRRSYYFLACGKFINSYITYKILQIKMASPEGTNRIIFHTCYAHMHIQQNPTVKNILLSRLSLLLAYFLRPSRTQSVNALINRKMIHGFWSHVSKQSSSFRFLFENIAFFFFSIFSIQIRSKKSCIVQIHFWIIVHKCNWKELCFVKTWNGDWNFEQNNFTENRAIIY